MWWEGGVDGIVLGNVVEGWTGVVGGRGRWYSSFQVGCPKRISIQIPIKSVRIHSFRTTKPKTAVWELSRATHIIPLSPPILLCSSALSLSYYSFPIATYYAYYYAHFSGHCSLSEIGKSL